MNTLPFVFSGLCLVLNFQCLFHQLYLLKIELKAVKQYFLAIVVSGFLFSCSTQDSSVEKTADSTSAVVDAQRAITKDSVVYKSDSSKKVIDSTFSKLKDSLKRSR